MASLRTFRGILALASVAAIAAATHPALAATILVAGSASGASTIGALLTNQGHSVTLSASDTLPTSLAAYSTVWVHTIEALSSSDLTKLEAFVESGRGVYINGERAGCCAGESANADVLVASTVAGAAAITVGNGFSSGTLNGTPNPAAVGGLTQTPYAPTHMALFGAGGIAGAATVNQLITGAGQVLAAAWSDADMVSGAGRIVVIMDSNWIGFSDEWEDEWIANLQTFLQSPDSDGDGVPDDSDPCTDTDGDGFGDPGHPANTCTLDACPSVAGVAPDGCVAAIPALSAGGRALLGLILLVLATPVARSAVGRIRIGSSASRRDRERPER